jgi:dienelactone hydrolase
VKFVRVAPLAVVVLLAAIASVPAQPQSVPAGPLLGPILRQYWLVPSTIPGVSMRTAILQPPGSGPFPLAVINHGSTADSDERESMSLAEFEPVASWFVDHGYLVALPQRPGHGETGGPYLEDIGSCRDPDYERAGLGAAASIEAAVQYLTRQPFVQKTGVVLVGHSAGAWGALAEASQDAGPLRAVINFAGGLGGHSYGEPNRNCEPERLVQAAAAFGQITRIPTLWLYSANDTYFDAALSQQMADAYRGAGGMAEYHLLPAFGEDGHFLIFSAKAVPTWAPIVAKFLQIRVQ